MRGAADELVPKAALSPAKAGLSDTKMPAGESAGASEIRATSAPSR